MKLLALRTFRRRKELGESGQRIEPLVDSLLAAYDQAESIDALLRLGWTCEAVPAAALRAIVKEYRDEKIAEDCPWPQHDFSAEVLRTRANSAMVIAEHLRSSLPHLDVRTAEELERLAADLENKARAAQEAEEGRQGRRDPHRRGGRKQKRETPMLLGLAAAIPEGTPRRWELIAALLSDFAGVSLDPRRASTRVENHRHVATRRARPGAAEPA